VNFAGPDQKAIAELLRGHEAFGQLSVAACDALVTGGRIVRYQPGDEILKQGAPSNAALFVISGEADILVETSYGDIQIARGLPKMLIGEIGAFAGLPRTATVRARTAVVVLEIAREQLLALGQDDPKLPNFIIAQLGEKMSRLNQAIGFYTNALSALEHNAFDTRLLEDLLNPMPELVDFSHSFLRLAEQITIKRRQFEEMANAAAIQRSMLPRPFAAQQTFAALDVYGELHPAREVGGDFYDYFAIDDRRIAITIGDVSGKGVPASLFMAISQSLVRVTLREGRDLGAEIARVNDMLAVNNDEAMFATAFCAVIDATSGEAVYCNCGHNAPLVLRNDGSAEPLPPTGPPLAARQNASFRVGTARLSPGDLLFLFTDGLPEASNAGGEFFGDERVAQAVRAHAGMPARDAVVGVISKVRQFESGAPQYDDIACLALIYRRDAR
jgi:serine phosphatase RsbU (regulator of sigma subunit)